MKSGATSRPPYGRWDEINFSEGALKVRITSCCLKSAFASLVLATFSGTLAQATPQAIELPGHRAFPESITSTADGSLYVSNIFEGGVLRVRNGKVEQWIAPGAFGSRSIYGVLADEKSGTLWLCSNDLTKYGMTTAGDPGSAVKGFDLTTGQGKVSARFPEESGTECNDLATDKEGNLFVTDTDNPRVLRLAKGTQSLKVFVEDPRFKHKDGGPDGIAFADDGTLYVNTFGGSSLFRIEVKGDHAGKVTKLKLSRPVSGTDGMRPISGNRFLMVDGQMNLNIVTMSGDTANLKVLRAHLDGPTGVTLVDNTAWVAEGRFAFLEKPDQQPPLTFHLQPVAMPTE
jgi:sugar lactone lactonase YvrE